MGHSQRQGGAWRVHCTGGKRGRHRKAAPNRGERAFGTSFFFVSFFHVIVFFQAWGSTRGNVRLGAGIAQAASTARIDKQQRIADKGSAAWGHTKSSVTMAAMIGNAATAAEYQQHQAVRLHEKGGRKGWSNEMRKEKTVELRYFRAAQKMLNRELSKAFEKLREVTKSVLHKRQPKLTATLDKVESAKAAQGSIQSAVTVGSVPFEPALPLGESGEAASPVSEASDYFCGVAAWGPVSSSVRPTKRASSTTIKPDSTTPAEEKEEMVVVPVSAWMCQRYTHALDRSLSLPPRGRPGDEARPPRRTRPAGAAKLTGV